MKIDKTAPSDHKYDNNNVQSMNIVSSFFFFIQSAYIEMKRRFGQFMLAFSSVLIVVAASAVS